MHKSVCSIIEPVIHVNRICSGGEMKEEVVLKEKIGMGSRGRAYIEKCACTSDPLAHFFQSTRR